ncbi:feruloyl-CoA synthetase [Rhodobacteraceae bacterium RKSG542]|uniref:feruloyl-CoA synthase n=1 Tax=Pseudovibrio flavus TaxID=2529854 RepID=UPI0012BCB0FE|nr:feruloyl-CoA synthase [Pseudovibrio flavus]MTI15928.1 feruloyl-CoA synthetase [Pseudovibrio flavus]
MSESEVLGRPSAGCAYIPHNVEIKRLADGTMRMTSRIPLDPVVEKTGVWLHHWARTAPDRVFIAERNGEDWREITYAQALSKVRSIGAALVTRGMGPDTPVAILSGNGVDHALLSYAAQYVGVPVVPLAEQYSLIPQAHARLAFVLDKIKPHLVFVEDAGQYAGALQLPELEGLEIVASKTDCAPCEVTSFQSLLEAEAGPELDAAYEAVKGNTLAKIFFTSGSSGDPKGVLTTQKMMCANQAQMASILPLLKVRPPKIVDWLPWNHVFGGSHNLNMMLAHGGSLYIDEGKPTAKDFGSSIENNRSQSGNIAFNVPVGFSMLVKAMEDDLELRRAYFNDLDLIFYAGASLPQDIWEKLERYAIEENGHLPLMISSWGMTETAPATLMLHEPIGRSGVIGVPLPGTEIKLIPDDDLRCELRVKGPNVMQGYYDDPAKTQESFDEDGFLITGDAVRFVNNETPEAGLAFDGRVSEDFKLTTGTWVHAGKLRLKVLEAMKGLVQDVVVCGHDRDAIGLFIFPKLASVKSANISDGAVTDPALQAEVEVVLRQMAAEATGSATRITRALILAEPPSLADHEITDKGSLNVRKIIMRRTTLLERLYDTNDPALIRV